MTLTEGSILGSYEITSLIGMGGMGEVYLARDIKLDRVVAIKVLPDELARDKERVLRFEREAKLLASLNHPNIAAIHGFEQADHKRFLVLEYAEGLTLSARLKDGPLSLDDSIEICKQIADALEAAHEKGIIHRDLKPANVAIAPDGSVKVLDFGLARAVHDDPSSSMSTAASPTITADYTRPGVVLGTAAYMSPEQARGRPLDKRSDIWSFGVVLFECLSGKMLFGGETTTDSMGAVLHKEPEWSLLPPNTPIRVQLVLRHCLSKDRKHRLHDIADARIELEEAAQQLASGFIESNSPPQAARRLFWPVLAGVLAVALVVDLSQQLVVSPESKTASAGPVVIGMEQVTDLPGNQSAPNLSPDGRNLLYVAKDGGDSDIFLMRVGGEKPINLTEDSPADEYSPAFSPDGEKIAYRSEREGGGIFVMGATGESPRRVSDEGFHPAWSPDGGRLVYTTEHVFSAYGRTSVAQLWIVNLELGGRQLLFEGDAVGPSWSPSGERIAFWAAIQGQRDIWTIPADGGQALAVTQDIQTDWNPLWSANGNSLYFISDRGGSADLWQIQIDEKSGQPCGDPTSVTTGVANVTEASLSARGQRIAVTISSRRSETLRYEFNPVTRQTVGQPSIIYVSSSGLDSLHPSSDGEWLAFRSSPPQEDIFVMRADGSSRRRLTDDMHRDRGPRWSPDGKWLLFYSNRNGSYELWLMRPDGTELRRLTDTPGIDLHQPVWSADGQRITVNRSAADGTSSVDLLIDRPLAEIDKLLLPTGPGIPGFISGAWSPGGRWLAGAGLNPLGSMSAALYDTQASELKLLRAVDGGYHVSPGPISTVWIDENHFMFWDPKRHAVFIWDTQSETSRELAGLPGPCELKLANDGRTLFLNRFRDEADIWALSLSPSAKQ
ncbi:MAG: protein kinase [Planctomycetota bacterium]|nr:protein kinase [Planctomycetota bacterium]